MFCGNCGKPIPEGKDTCEFCNPPAQQEVEYQIPPAPEDIPAPAAEAPEFTLSSPVESEEKPKKKAGKLGLIIGAAALVLAVLLAALNWKPISRFFIRTFSAPEAYLAVVEKDAAADVAEDIATAYDEYLASYDSKGGTANIAVGVEVGDMLMTTLQTALNQSGVNMDIAWLESVSLQPVCQVYENTMKLDLLIGINDKPIITITGIWDLDSQQIYIGAPGLHDTFIQMDAVDLFGSDAYDIADTMIQSREMSEQLMEIMPTGEQLKTLITTYWGLIFESIEEGEKETQKVSCGGLEQNMTVITVELSQKDVLKIAENVLKHAKKDKTIGDILDDVGDYMTDLYGYEMDMEELFEEAVEEALDSIDEAKEYVERGDFITLETFIDGKNEIVGRTITVEVDGEEVELYYITVTEGKEFAFQAEIADMAVIEGEGTLSGDKRTGSYTLSVDGTEYVTLELEDFSCTDGKPSGTLRIVPCSDLYSSAGAAASAVSILSTATVELTFDESTVRLAVEISGAEMLALTFSADYGKAQPIDIPDSIDANDDNAAMEWVSELDLSTLISNLKEAGVPNDYVKLLEDVADQLQ